MYAFIVRPFGTKKNTKGVDVDFDDVEAKLIRPALAALPDVQGGTTALIVEQGNIRTDMFQLLVTADLVIADISKHNANVYYELGIRHALRRGLTFLIRHSDDEVPFDVKTDRYFSYNAANPAASVGALAAALRATIGGDRTNSPVFQLLPELREPDFAALHIVPRAFAESVQLAARSKHKGDLALFGEECRGRPWEGGALRLVGEAQFRLKSYEGARITWEAVKHARPEDVLANQRLATIYQKLGQIDLSDLAIERVLRGTQVTAQDLAEAYALAASNKKRRWVESWSAGDSAGRTRRALQSPLLEAARKDYYAGFKASLDQFYPGLNALALVCIECELADLHPEDWSAKWATEDEAERELGLLKNRRERLAAAVETCFEAADQRNPNDRWLTISRADFALLRGKSGLRLEQIYRNALANAEVFDISSLDAQLNIFRDLGLYADGVAAAATVVEEIRAAGGPAFAVSATAAAPPRILLFTGHRVDSPQRKTPRFPAQSEAVARKMIEDAVAAERVTAGGTISGIAGGASGGDILFHEVCAGLEIPIRVFLAAPRDAFVAASVQDSQNGADWVQRFDRLVQTHPSRHLGDSLDVPSWHAASGDPSAVWSRNNLWMLHNALDHGAAQMTLIALWNGEGGDGPGGTEDMIRRAQQRGARVIILDAKKLI